MSTQALHPVTLRVLLISLVVFLLGTSLVTFYRFADSATDENLFATPPSNLVVTRPIPAFADAPGSVPMRPDTIPAGRYIYRIMQVRGFVEDLAAFPADSIIYARAYDPLQRNTSVRYYARVRDLRDSTNYHRFPDHVVVCEVTPGGASDRAGMHLLDRIVAINGQAFRTSEEADLLMRQGQSGKALDYDILRDDRLMRLHVTMASFGFPLPVLVLSLTGLVIFAIGAFILLKRPELIAARLLGLSMILSGFFISMLLVAQRDTGSPWFTFPRDMLLYASFALIFPVSRHAATYFPREIPAMRNTWWSIGLQYIFAGAVIILAVVLIGLPASLAIKNIIFFSLSTVLLGGSSVILMVLTRTQRTPEYLRMNRAIRYGKWIAFIGVVGLNILFSLNRWGGLYGFIGVPLLAIPISHLYVIGRYRLLDIQLRVRRNVQWGFLSAVWGCAMLSLLFTALFHLVTIDFGLPQVTVRGLSVEVEPGVPSAAAPQLPARGLSVILAIGTFVAVRAVRKTGQSYIDRTFYRQPTDYTRAVSALSEVLSKRVSMVELGRGMVQRLAEVLRLKQAGVLFFREDGACCCHEAIGVSEETWSITCDVEGGALARQLGQLPAESRVEYLPAGLKERFENGGFRFVIPIRSKERLIGVLLLGEKQSEASYSPGELEFLSAAARQSSVAIENAFLYEELAEKERMETELQIARRIQLASLPQRTPSSRTFDIAGISMPALEVGGDFYDYLATDDRRLTVIVGDVSGKGTSAALYMSKVQGILRSLNEFRLSPGAMFVRANRLLAADMARNSFVTAIGATFVAATRTVIVARAGHLPLYAYRASSRTVEKLTPRGLGLALDENRKFVQQLREQRTRFAAGDVFLFVSDGVIEAHNEAGEEYGETRLQALLRRDARKTATEIRDAALADLDRFLDGREREDDCTVVVVRILSNKRIA